jgi:hypothetical protein
MWLQLIFTALAGTGALIFIFSPFLPVPVLLIGILKTITLYRYFALQVFFFA